MFSVTKKITLYVLLASIGMAAMVVLNYLIISLSTRSDITSSEKELVKYHHILIPGAGNSPLGEWQNPTFSRRLNACVELYTKNKITRIVCSGITKRPYYYEPEAMEEFLLKKQIPAGIILLDDEGNNTRQTVFNYATKFKNDSVIIISQRLQLERAVFAAKFYGLQVKGFSVGKYKAEENKFIYYEIFARMKLSLELLVRHSID